ncbi:restriction endonuclease subunit S [Patescibacteria group bacterium]|nr:restriction endonuclease subunit S [Patescibacteria group bacterium]
MKNNWQTKKLGEVLKLEYGKPLPISHRKSGGLYPVYGANGIKNFSDKFYCDKPSIIVGRKGSAGEINLTEKKFWPLDVTYFVTFDQKKYDLKFIYNLLATLNLPQFAKGIKPGINRNDMYSLNVKIPNSLVEQKRIVSILDKVFEKIEKAKGNAKKKFADLEELKKSVLQKAFEGKL